MPQRIEDRVRPITPQLAWRVAVLGGIAFVLFGIVFFRLWYLQVLSGQDYVVQASENRLRKERIEAPRGNIVDRHGETLVETKRAAVVQIKPSSLPEAVLDQADEYRKALAAAENERLKAADRYEAYSRQLRDDGRKNTKRENRQRAPAQEGVRAGAQGRDPAGAGRPSSSSTASTGAWARCSTSARATIHERVIRGVADTPFSNVTIRTDVDPAEFDYMRERPEYFPGVEVTRRYLRQYPHGKLAAQLFGTISEITEDQRKEEDYAGIEQGTRIGQSGLEAQYDKYLRGVDGYSRVVVDAFGSRDEERRLSVREPKQGQRLKLTLDYKLQRVGDRALSKAIQASRARRQAGAYVAMDPRDGAILAMGSQPGFDASVFARPFSQQTYEDLTSQAKGAPLLNRATESAYPTGSVFKPITALAALEEGLIGPNDDDQRHRPLRATAAEVPERQGRGVRHDQPSDALKVSSDVFFYHLGERAPTRRAASSSAGPRSSASGARPGSTSRASRPGLVPDAQVAQRRLRALRGVRRRRPGCSERTMAALYECGGVERGWSARRQRQPRRRPGRPAGHAAAGRGRLLRAGQQRHDRDAAPRQGDRGRQRRHVPGAAHQAAAQGQDQPARPPDRARRPARRRQRGGRHVDRRLQGLAHEAVPDLRQDRHRGAPAQPRPVVVRVLRQGRRHARSWSS